MRSSCCPCLGFCKLPHVLPKSPLLLKQIGLGFLLIPSEVTFTEILPDEVQIPGHSNKDLQDLVPAYPSIPYLNTLTSYSIFQSYLAPFLKSSFYSSGFEHAVFSPLITHFSPYCLANFYLAFPDTQLLL